MFTISCYSFHPLIRRFLTLWRYAQVVSDCLTFVLSFLCCQCGSMMPLSGASSSEGKPSVEAFKIMSDPIIDAGRASGEPFRPQHLVIDFTPQPEDSEETSHKCQSFWEAVRSNPDLEGLMALPERDSDKIVRELSAVPVHRASSPPLAKCAFPAMQLVKNLGEQGVIDTAFAATTSKLRR